MNRPILGLEVRLEQDIVLARQRARQIADLLGFDAGEQTRIATAVSEIVRNAYSYGGGGRVTFSVEGDRPPQALLVHVRDDGPGIADLPRILAGRYTSTTGMGMGIVGARRLMDRFEIESSPAGGTRVLLGKFLPRRAPVIGPRGIAQVATDLARQAPQSPFEEVRQQNQELLQTLEELRARQEQLASLNRELEDTNRGVLALYAELAEKADHLRRSDELKSRFLSNMSHEFRTPLHSILALSRILLDRTDGDLTGEQEKQVVFIRDGADDLLDLVNDLLDLAKVEAGRITVRPAEFTVADLFSALKGMLRLLLVVESVSLVFEEPSGLPPLYTDEAKVSQILRNVISNALKFTERGEIRVAATLDATRGAVIFSVADTGIGIAPEDQERIFQEFGQIEGPHQARVKGTGLGLPLARRLAELLGGRLSVQSAPGLGANVSAIIPVVYSGAAEVSYIPEVRRGTDPTRLPVLVLEDDRETLLIYEKYLRGTGFQVIPVRTVKAAREALREVRPIALVLDILLAGEHSWEFLAAFKQDEATRDIPVYVATMVDNRQKALAMGADDCAVKPVEREWLLSGLERARQRIPVERLLVIDDDETSRYLVGRFLADTRYTVTGASDGAEGLRRARQERPAVIVLDLGMPKTSGFEILDRLRADPATADIPVVVYSGKTLTEEDRHRLTPAVVAVVAKEVGSQEVALAALRQALAIAALRRTARAAA